MNNKKCIFLTSLVLGSSLLFAQQANNQIELPDLTTVINSDNLKAENDALPDFNEVLEVSGDSGTVSIQLPDVDNQNTQVEAKVQNNKAEKSIFAEGRIGGGYPNLFTGNFSVFRQTGDNPFKVDFNHESAAGYSGNSLNDGFSDASSSMQVQKKVTKDNFVWNINGSYINLENGLQKKAGDIYSYNQNQIFADTSLLWNFPKGHSLEFDLNAKNYNRYANITNSAPVEDWVKKSTLFAVEPGLIYEWSGKHLNAGTSVNYSMDIYDDAVSRVQMMADFGWKNDYVSIGADAGIVLSNKMNSNIVVPFSLGVQAAIPVKFANRSLSFGVEGGIESSKTDIADLEIQNRFTGFNAIPSEVSDWYGKFNFILPLWNSFTATADVIYKQTAFDNGVWEPGNTNISLVNGLYTYSQNDQQVLASNLSISYFYKMFSASVAWNQNWMDVPYMNYVMKISIIAALTAESGKWGLEGSSDFMFWDTPAVNVNGFFRITPAVSLVAEASDLINLFGSSNTRKCGYKSDGTSDGSGFNQYIERSGSVTFLLRFNF